MPHTICVGRDPKGPLTGPAALLCLFQQSHVPKAGGICSRFLGCVLSWIHFSQEAVAGFQNKRGNTPPSALCRPHKHRLSWMPLSIFTRGLVLTQPPNPASPLECRKTSHYENHNAVLEHRRKEQQTPRRRCLSFVTCASFPR